MEELISARRTCMQYTAAYLREADLRDVTNCYKGVNVGWGRSRGMVAPVCTVWAG